MPAQDTGLRVDMRKTRYITTIILLSTLLSGCITATVVGGTAAGAAATALLYDQRPTKVIVSDEKLSHTIQSRLDANTQLRTDGHISVAVYRGWVLLVGQVATEALKQQALDIIKTVPNITKLYDEINIAPPIDHLARANDVWLTTKIKAKLLTEKGLESGQFKIVSEDNTIYLMGLASKAQTDLAVGIIRETGGVEKVVTIIMPNSNQT